MDGWLVCEDDSFFNAKCGISGNNNFITFVQAKI
jgi:hypothetical protein